MTTRMKRWTKNYPQYWMTNAYDEHLTVRSVKHQIDGALGSRGAWLLEPYDDARGSARVLHVEQRLRRVRRKFEGSITTDKYADFTVLSKDIMSVPAEEIFGADVLYTIVAGEVRYRQRSD